MKRALPDTSYITDYEVKFQNGAIAEPKNLDEVFEGENWGPAGIRRVSIMFHTTESTIKTRIGIKFTNADNTNVRDSIVYVVEGEDRDWVFVASSQISERITRIERLNFQRIVNSRILPMVIMLVFLIGTLVYMMSTISRQEEPRSTVVKQLRQEWTAGIRRDPVDVILRIEESNRNRIDTVWLVRGIMVPGAVFIVAIIIADPVLRYLFPPYNFVWGEYQIEYEKRKGRTRFIFVGVILTIVLGVLVNFLSNKFGW